MSASGGSPSSGGGGRPPEIDVSTYTPAPARNLDGRVVIADIAFPETVNPYQALQLSELRAFGALAFNGLVVVTPDLRYIPDLAAEIPLEGNGGVVLTGAGMDVTWRLKPGMKWSDGERIGCDDLEATWRWITDPDRTGLVAGTAGWDSITGIDAVSETECVMHFDRVYSGYLTLVNPLLPAHRISTTPRATPTQALYSLQNARMGTYSGPFVPTEVTLGEQITFTRNPEWSTISGREAYLEEVAFRYFATTGEMVDAYRAGEVDVVGGLSGADLPRVSDVPMDNIVQRDAQMYELLAFNNAWFGETFGEDWQEIVRALQRAIDRPAIADELLASTVEAIVSPVPPAAWYHLDLGPVPRGDPAGASSDLDRLGWQVGGDGVRVRNGQALAFELCTTERQDRIDVATLIAAQLSQIGVRLTVVVRPRVPDMFGAWADVPEDTPCNLYRGNFSLALYSSVSSLDPLGGYPLYASDASPEQPPHTGQNYARASVPEIDDAYRIIRRSVDLLEVRDAAEQLQRIYGSEQNVFELPLFVRRDVWLVTTKIRNFTGNASTAGGQWNIGDWWLTE